jgi:hypothetical protein
MRVEFRARPAVVQSRLPTSTITYSPRPTRREIAQAVLAYLRRDFSILANNPDLPANEKHLAFQYINWKLFSDPLRFDNFADDFPWEYFVHHIANGETRQIQEFALSIISKASNHASFPANRLFSPEFAIFLVNAIPNADLANAVFRLFSNFIKRRSDIRDFILPHLSFDVFQTRSSERAQFLVNCLSPDLPPEFHGFFQTVIETYLGSGDKSVCVPLLKGFKLCIPIFWSNDVWFSIVTHGLVESNEPDIILAIARLVRSGRSQLPLEVFELRMNDQIRFECLCNFLFKFSIALKLKEQIRIDCVCKIIKLLCRDAVLFRQCDTSPLLNFVGNILNAVPPPTYRTETWFCRIFMKFVTVFDRAVVSFVLRFVNDAAIGQKCLKYLIAIMRAGVAGENASEYLGMLEEALPDIEGLQDSEKPKIARAAVCLLSAIAEAGEL